MKLSKAQVLTSKDKFPLQINFEDLLLKASEKELVALQIPETLLKHPCTQEPVFLYTDKEGFVRSLTGPRYGLCSASTGFLSACRAKLKQRKAACPQGHRFPKYVSFVNSTALCTLDKAAELQGYLMGHWERVQRFIVSKGFHPYKLVMRLRKSKNSKLYRVTSRPILHSRQSTDCSAPTADSCLQTHDSLGPVLDYNYVVSLRDWKTCEIQKEKTPCEELEAMAAIVKFVIEEYGIEEQEQVEELVINAIESQDGRLYFLNAGRGKTMQRVEQKRRAGHRFTQSMGGASARAAGKEKLARLQSSIPHHITPSESVPELPMISSTSSIGKLRSCPHSPSASSRMISQYLGNIASKLDELRGQAHALRQVNGSKQVVKFKGRPPGFLQSFIGTLYDSVMKDPKLTRYFRHKDQIRNQVESAVRHVIVNGISKSRLRSIHERLYITDAAFDSYASCFLSALQSEGVRSEEVEAAREFLEGCREDIVIARWESTEER